MNYKYKIELQNLYTIRDAIDALKSEKLNIESQTEVLRNRVAEKLRDYSDTGFSAAVQHIWQFSKTGFISGEESLRMPTVEVRAGGVGRTIVIAESEDVLFIQFGTGVYHNTGRPFNSEANRLGMIIGGYGKGHGNEDKWMFPDDVTTGAWWWTHGIESAPAMSIAKNMVESTLTDIAMEVWP